MGMNAEHMRHIQAEEAKGNAAGVAFLKGHQMVFNAARDAGIVTELPVLSEVSAEIQRLSPEQILGLKEVAFDLVVPTYAKSMDQLVLQERARFGYVNESESFREITPQAAEVAVRSGQLAIPGSNNLSLDDQRQMVVDLEKSLRKKRLSKGATLTGVTFGLDHASTHAQIDFGFQDQNGGKPLYEGMYARTEDPTYGSSVAGVGRLPGHPKLHVVEWGARDGSRGVWAVPVARPAGK